MVALGSELSLDAAVVHDEDYKLPISPELAVPCPKYTYDDPTWLPRHCEWRRDLINWIGDDEQRQREVMKWCARSPLFYINAFVWITRQNIIASDGSQRGITTEESVLPLVTWVVQDELVGRMIESIENGRSLMIDKSREMGATFLSVAVFDWFWRFRPGVVLGEMSRKALLVDDLDNPYSLFSRHDLIHRMLPPWMRPKRTRKRNLIVNLENGSSLVGEPTTGDVGQAGRAIAYFIDEAARIDNLRAVDASLSDTTSCKIINSTAQGPTQFSKMLAEGRYPVFQLHWSRHPEKGRGRYMGEHPHKRTRAIRSPWYDKQVASRSEKDTAMNLDMDHASAGTQFFSQSAVIRQKQEHGRKPTRQGFIRMTRNHWSSDLREVCRRRDASLIDFNETRKGEWSIFCPLMEDSRGMLRPPQDATYVIGCDVSVGVGSSESCIYVIDHETGEQVAEFASANVSPDELAQFAVLAGVWFGGRGDVAMIGWEANGVGQRFARELVRVLGYPRYLRMFKDDKVAPDTTSRLGWVSTNESKIDMLGALDKAISDDTHRCHSLTTLGQFEEYVWFEGRFGVGPGVMEQETADARATHGDRVIAAGVAEFTRQFVPRPRSQARHAVAGTPSEVIAQLDAKRPERERRAQWRG